MSSTQARRLILACGNTLRSDDGVGLWLAAWAEQRFSNQSEIKIIARQQWTPELAEDVSRAESVLFIDCSVDSPPGSIRLTAVEPAVAGQGIATHHSGAAELLALARDYYACLPKNAQLLTIGAGSTELGEVFSEAVTAVLPEACRLIEVFVAHQIQE
jgi:hydrogenase maturation protease